jgi:hypothetical protein
VQIIAHKLASLFARGAAVFTRSKYPPPHTHTQTNKQTNARALASLLSDRHGARLTHFTATTPHTHTHTHKHTNTQTHTHTHTHTNTQTHKHTNTHTHTHKQTNKRASLLADEHSSRCTHFTVTTPPVMRAPMPTGPRQTPV